MMDNRQREGRRMAAPNRRCTGIGLGLCFALIAFATASLAASPLAPTTPFAATDDEKTYDAGALDRLRRDFASRYTALAQRYSGKRMHELALEAVERALLVRADDNGATKAQRRIERSARFTVDEEALDLTTEPLEEFAADNPSWKISGGKLTPAGKRLSIEPGRGTARLTPGVRFDDTTFEVQASIRFTDKPNGGLVIDGGPQGNSRRRGPWRTTHAALRRQGRGRAGRAGPRRRRRRSLA